MSDPFYGISYDVVDKVVVGELKWAYEHALKQIDHTVNDEAHQYNTNLSNALELVLAYFMPASEFTAYIAELDEKQ